MISDGRPPGPGPVAAQRETSLSGSEFRLRFNLKLPSRPQLTAGRAACSRVLRRRSESDWHGVDNGGGGTAPESTRTHPASLVDSDSELEVPPRPAAGRMAPPVTVACRSASAIIIMIAGGSEGQ